MGTATAKEYSIHNGTHYDKRTDPTIISVLEYARSKRLRIELDYGDTDTGRSWGETHDILGYVGRSTGRIKIPILVHNSRSMGGGAILDHCIIRIRTSKGKEVLYQHPNYYINQN
jgi:hypothetical protein